MSGMSDNNAASTSAAAAHEDSHHPLEIMPSVHQGPFLCTHPSPLSRGLCTPPGSFNHSYNIVEAWEQKHLPRLQYETLDHAVYRWSLSDWSWDRLEKRRQKLFSPEFSCGGHTWCVCRMHIPWMLHSRPTAMHSHISLASFSEVAGLFSPAMRHQPFAVPPLPRAPLPPQRRAHPHV